MSEKLHDDARLAAELASMGYKFYWDRVFLSIDPAEQVKLGSGILVAPEGTTEKPYSGTVVALGTGELVPKCNVQVCDRIIIQRWNPTECKVRRADGSDKMLVAIHVNDLYIGWTDEELVTIYQDKLKELVG